MSFFHLVSEPNSLLNLLSVFSLGIVRSIRVIATMTLLLVEWGFLGMSPLTSPGLTILVPPLVLLVLSSPSRSSLY
jgi:hypothetical protein